MAGTGSTLVTAVVPTVATTASGVIPFRRSSSMAAARASGRIRKRSSVAMRRSPWWPSPKVITALSTDEWACSEQ